MINAPSGISLARVGDQVNACGGLDAAQDQKVHHPQQDRRAHDRLQVFPLPKIMASGVSVKKLSAAKTITRYETLAINRAQQ